MIDTKTIKKIARGILKKSNHKIADHRIMHPRREWLVFLSVGLVLFAICVIWSMQLYKTYSEVVFETTVEVESATAYRAGDVANALELFATRKARYETLQENLSSPQPIPTSLKVDVTEPIAEELGSEAELMPETEITTPETEAEAEAQPEAIPAGLELL